MIDPKKTAKRMFGVGKGPLDKYRDKKPAYFDQDEWDAYIDERNQEYSAEHKKGMGFKTKAADRLERMTLGDVISQGRRAGAFKKDATKQGKRDAATEIAGSARDLTNKENFRQQQVDLESQNANQADQEALKNLTSQYADLDKKDQNALADYLSKTDPMMAEIFAKSSDPADIQRQLDAYNEQKGVVDKYKTLTDPTVTGQERYMSELARREFESADRSNREAVSEQMANRGLRSGGQELAANQQAQQGLAQDRLLKELGIQAGAVDRSTKAMGGWSSASQNLSLQSNAIRSANDSQRQYEETFKQKEQERIGALAGERQEAQTTVNANAGERGGKLYDAGTGTTARRVGRAISGAATAADIGAVQHDRLAEALGIGVDQATDELESDLQY